MLIAIIASMVPYYLVYRIIKPLTEGGSVGVSKLAASLGISAGCLVLHAVLYVLGLKFSHIAAYNTLKNLRCSLKRKMEKQPLGTIQEKGSGRIKKLFTDDIEQVELLLAHAIPEGIANLGIAVIAVICMFFADWRLALLSLGSLPLGMFAMGMMFKSGMAKMNDYYTAATKMNNTIENADKILVISGGKLAEQGTHSELMQKGGIYCGFVKRRQQAAMRKM